MEALACGVPPVVTDIPSFRLITGAAVGALWPCGDWHSLRAALVRVARAPKGEQRAAARAHFERELSAAAMGRALGAAYLALSDSSQEAARQL